MDAVAGIVQLDLPTYASLFTVHRHSGARPRGVRVPRLPARQPDALHAHVGRSHRLLRRLRALPPLPEGPAPAGACACAWCQPYLPRSLAKSQGGCGLPFGLSLRSDVVTLLYLFSLLLCGFYALCLYGSAGRMPMQSTPPHLAWTPRLSCADVPGHRPRPHVHSPGQPQLELSWTRIHMINRVFKTFVHMSIKS